MIISEKLENNLITEIKSFIFCHTIFTLPGVFGFWVRNLYYKKKLKQCGILLEISPYVILDGAKNISIGNRCRINRGVHINGHGGITIGNYILIGMNVVILTANHNFDKLDIPIYCQDSTANKVDIGDDVWLGANSIILPGVSIGRGCVVGAGSVVTKNIPEYSIAVGNPAKVIKTRKMRQLK